MMSTQLEGNNVYFMLRSQVPKSATIMPAIWQMKCKHHILTQEVYKWKARLNIDGSRQVKG